MVVVSFINILCHFGGLSVQNQSLDVFFIVIIFVAKVVQRIGNMEYGRCVGLGECCGAQECEDGEDEDFFHII